MLEAPEAFIMAHQLNATITDKTISLIIAGHTPHKFTFYNGDPSDYELLLTGRTICGAHNYGGLVEVEMDGVRLLFSDGANISYIEPGGKIPSKHQLLIGFDDESCITVSTRMYGLMLAYREGEEMSHQEYYNSSRTKPQVLSADFSEEYFIGLINSAETRNRSAKAFLATNQTIPGLGNGVLQDILFNAHIHPKTKISTLTAGERKSLYDSIISTLSDMVSNGGRDSEKDLFGNSGKYIPYLSKNTEGLECTRCGSIIVKENYMGGSIYYCTGCQHKK